ncbi:MAG: SDR family oxidoreductase [Acidobacteria bacterium]|nr:SDR family oxidoreductase [Acidobacteriota bacterium]
MADFLNGKVAVVTGGSRGIGLKIAERLLGEGASVAISGRDGKTLADAGKRMQAASSAGGPGRIEAVVSDVRSYADVEKLMARAAERFGGIDYLVNNAGIGIFKSVERLTPDEWDAVIQTNLSGVFYCVRAVVPYMKKRGGGYIVNISSLAGKNAFAGGAAYNASKFGLNGFSEAMMLDLRYDNIRTTYVMPGSVDTKFANNPTGAEWKVAADDVAQSVVGLLRSHPRSMFSRIEVRPSQPPRK